MINIPVDASASILERFYESGDSYKGHHKYNVLQNYRMYPVDCASIIWDGLELGVKANSTSVMERDNIEVDVTGYNRFRFFGIIPTWVHVKLYCNGELVVDEDGNGTTGYVDGNIRISHNTVKSLRYEFTNMSDNDTIVSVHYLGMLSDVPREESPFNDEWEGFFDDEPDYGIYDEVFITEEEMELLREKVKIEPYKSYYEKVRQEAYEAMNDYPEKLIARTVYKHHRCKVTIRATQELAIVGQIERNKDMLKMACRSALSIATCEHWTSDVMEIIPMQVWKQRSFTESYMSQKVCTVLWLAGGLLSWHGRNYLYNMLIMKALPRLEADFMTMDYIYKCNQGISFMHGYMQALITLSKPFPRYKKKIEDAKEILNEVFDNNFGADGSFEEGAMYYNYTLRHLLPTIHYISRYEGKSVKDFYGERLSRISEYGLSVLAQDGRFIAMGDCGAGLYTMVIPAMLYAATGDMRWASLMKNTQTYTLVEMVISVIAKVPESNVDFASEFAYFPGTGFARTCRSGVMFAVTSGQSNDTHAHCDKGSFIIYKDGEILVPDVYAPYNYAEAVDMYKTSKHSFAIPVFDGKYVDQLRGKQYKSVVEKASCKNGVFEFSCDNSTLWNSDDVILSKRSFYSEKPNEFIITDEFEFKREGSLEFRINITKGADVKVVPQNWEIVEENIKEIFNFRDKIILQKSILSKKAMSHKIITKIIV